MDRRAMERIVRLLVVFLLMSFICSISLAAEPFFYPEKGQSPEQMDQSEQLRDQYECAFEACMDGKGYAIK